MNVLALISRRDFKDEDIIFLNKISKLLHVATVNDEPAIGKNRTIVLPDYPIDKNLVFKTQYYDTLALISDEGWKELKSNIVKVVLSGFINSGKLVILTGLTPVLLAEFDIIHGITITYRREISDYDGMFKKKNIYVVDAPFFLDRNILTIKDSSYILKIESILRLAGKNILL